MKQTVSLYQFRQSFFDYGRKDQFSHNGLEVLYDYLIELEESIGVEFELDPIAICCDFWEDSAGEIVDHYRLDSLQELEDNTEVYYVDQPPGKWVDAENREEWEDITIIIRQY